MGDCEGADVVGALEGWRGEIEGVRDGAFEGMRVVGRCEVGGVGLPEGRRVGDRVLILAVGGVGDLVFVVGAAVVSAPWHEQIRFATESQEYTLYAWYRLFQPQPACIPNWFTDPEANDPCRTPGKLQSLSELITPSSVRVHQFPEQTPAYSSEFCRIPSPPSSW